MRLPRAAAAAAAVLATLAALPGVPAGAADAPGGEAASAPRIAAVEVTGATRTTRDTLLHIARVREGDPWRPGLEAEVRQNLLNSGIFYDVAVAREDAGDGPRLRISLREKWTLIPLPLFVVKDGSTTWGGTLIESNLLGRGSRLIALLAVRDGRPGGTLLYIDPHLRRTRYQLFAALVRGDARQGAWDADRETGAVRRRTTGGTLALGYRFAPRTSVSAGLRLTNFSFAEPEGDAALPADARERAFSLMLRHEGADLDEERRRGLSAEVRLEVGASLLGDGVGRTAAAATARWAATTPGGQTLGLAGHLLWTDTPDLEPGSRAATAFLRGYEADRFRPDRLVGGSVEHQVPVARLRSATVSLVPFADAAVLRDRHRAFALADARADAGLALAVYLRRVALPVLQLYGAYGFSSRRVLPGFSLGFAF